MSYFLPGRTLEVKQFGRKNGRLLGNAAGEVGCRIRVVPGHVLPENSLKKHLANATDLEKQKQELNHASSDFYKLHTGN